MSNADLNTCRQVALLQEKARAANDDKERQNYLDQAKKLLAESKKPKDAAKKTDTKPAA
tara:strand:+ start:182 stop:358 length:177 start_codon:yes stop_codon:yes gene_type:complete